jgi:predicted transcriptional regulator of viral defense system
LPHSRFDELVTLAEDNNGLVTAEHARQAGFTDSVLARLVQRGRIGRTSRGVYRVPYVTPDRFSQYREAVLWAKANRGPEHVAVSHMTALAVYQISDANPHAIHLTVPKATRLRRQKPKGIVIHWQDITGKDIRVYEGLPLTTIARTVADLLNSDYRIDLIRQAISEARREGLLADAEARQLHRSIAQRLRDTTSSGHDLARAREKVEERDAS